MKRYDLVVIGGGAGGLTAAREARRRGASVVIVQDGPLGGDCTFTGCVPSKALLSAAARGESFDDAMTSVRTAIQRVAASEDAAALDREGIDTIAGFGRFRDPTSIEVNGAIVGSKRFIIATGSRPTIPPVPGLQDSAPLTNETLFDLHERPASLVILGGGPIGCEMAQAFARLGSRVTVIEAADRLLSREEPDASAVVARALARDGVTVRLGVKARAVERAPDGTIRIDIDADAPVDGTNLLAAVGRRPSSSGFGLQDIGVDVHDSGAIAVDDTMATSVDGIWAIGDVTGGPQFTHVAARTGWIAAANALSKVARIRRFRFDARVVPSVTFTDPEIARVGLTESEAAQRHPNARVAHLPLTHVDRAIAAGYTDGFVTLIAAPGRITRHLAGGHLLGATIVAPAAGEMIHEAALAMQTNMFVGRLAQTTHAYPTWSMAVQQAALQFFGWSAGLRARPVQAQPAV